MEKQQTAPHKRTGASNLEYDLFAEIHSLLKGNAVLERYVEDARSEGDKEAESCFQTIHDTNRQHAEKVRILLAKRLAQTVQKAA
jgi:hypothetical protein